MWGKKRTMTGTLGPACLMLILRRRDNVHRNRPPPPQQQHNASDLKFAGRQIELREDFNFLHRLPGYRLSIGGLRSPLNKTCFSAEA